MKRGLLLFILCLATLLGAEEPIRLTVADTIPGGDRAARDFAVAVARRNTALSINIHRYTPEEGVAALKDGRADLLLLQEADATRSLTLPRRRYAAAAAILLVHKDNPAKEISREQLFSIFRGEMDSWEQLNDTSFKIHPFLQADQTPGESVFRRKIMRGASYAEGLFRRDKASELVLLAGANSNALAVCGMTSTAGQPVHPLAVGGELPYLENIRAGKYPLTEFRYVYSSATPSANATAFAEALAGKPFEPFAAPHELVAAPSEKPE